MTHEECTEDCVLIDSIDWEIWNLLHLFVYDMPAFITYVFKSQKKTNNIT